MPKKVYSIKKLSDNLAKLGVKPDDTLLVRANLGCIGRIDSKTKNDYLKLFLDAIGKDGTLVGLAFTKSSFVKLDNSYIFDGKNKSYTGSFANLMLKYKEAIRSSHPTNSFVAIGKNANYIVSGHNEYAGAYEPIRKIMELNGKMLLIGIASDSPGFTTVHLSEIDLGYHKKIIFPTLNKVQYKDRNNTRVFKRTDLGSCSSTFYKFYSYYINNELLSVGYIGNAYSLLINAVDAYNVDYSVLRNEPKITICNNPDCMLCRARRWDNLKDLPIFVLRMLFSKIKQINLIKR